MMTVLDQVIQLPNIFTQGFLSVYHLVEGPRRSPLPKPMATHPKEFNVFSMDIANVGRLQP